MKLIIFWLTVISIVNLTTCRDISYSQITGTGYDTGEFAGDFNPDDWQFKSRRDDIAPLYSRNNDLIYRSKPTLQLSGGGKKYVDGSWFTVKDILPGTFYRFSVHYKADQVDQPGRTVLANIVWMDKDGKQIGVAEFPRTLHQQSPEGWNIIEQVYNTPPNARKAGIELIYRWDAEGTVHFGNASFTEVSELPLRTVRLATVFHRPAGSKDAQDNLDQFADLITEAGANGADIICLPEGLTLIGTGNSYISAAETVPGPSSRYLGAVARKNNMYVIAGIVERDGDVVYNTAILLDRNGELAGKYRKVSLPREEIEGGMTPGDDLPVFDTDFGRIGIMICWDVSFPEVARTLAMKGAEVIFLPIWGGNLTLTRARAIENQVYLVSSTYDMISAIFDLEGNVIDEADVNSPVVVSEVDLNRQILWPWLGDFKNRIPREMPDRIAIEW
jgi:predicted amidohydrolase